MCLWRVRTDYIHIPENLVQPKAPSVSPRPVTAVTEARLVNTLTSTSLTSRSRVISALGRYNQRCGGLRNVQIFNTQGERQSHLLQHRNHDLSNILATMSTFDLAHAYQSTLTNEIF